MLAFGPLLERIAQGLDSLGIPYMVMGGQAVLAYGEPRLTRDIHVTLGAGLDELTRLLGWAREAGWKALPHEPEKFARQHLVLPCQDAASGIRLDIIFSLSPYELQAVGRAISLKIGSTAVRFAAVEDLIVLKVVAGRPRDLEDLRGILAKKPKLDATYIRRWLREIEHGQEHQLVARFDALSSDQPQ